MSIWISSQCQEESHRSEPTSNPSCSDPSKCYCVCHDPRRPYIDLDLEARKIDGKPIEVTRLANV